MIFLPGLQYKPTRTHHQGHLLERKCFEMGASANSREIKNTFRLKRDSNLEQQLVMKNEK